MVEVINTFEGRDLVPSRVAPPRCNRWTGKECVVYGEAPDGESGEEGKVETLLSVFNHHPVRGYPIMTVGKGLEEIRAGVEGFLKYAECHPEMRFHVRKVGYHKAGRSVREMAPMFRAALGMGNVLLPEEMLEVLSE